MSSKELLQEPEFARLVAHYKAYRMSLVEAMRWVIDSFYRGYFDAESTENAIKYIAKIKHD